MIEKLLRLIADQDELCETDDRLDRLIRQELADYEDDFLSEAELENVQAARKEPEKPANGKTV